MNSNAAARTLSTHAQLLKNPRNPENPDSKPRLQDKIRLSQRLIGNKM